MDGISCPAPGDCGAVIGDSVGHGAYVADETSGAWSSAHQVAGVAGSATLRCIAVSFSYAGAGTIQVDAQSQVTGATATGTPTGSGALHLANAQGNVVEQAVVFLPGLITSGQFTTLVNWATANHTFTAA